MSNDHDINQCTALVELACALSKRFYHFYNPCDLDEAIEKYHAAVDLYPSAHPRRSQCLNDLIESLHGRFLLRGREADLDEAICLSRSSLQLCPPGHPDRHRCLNNHAFSLRYQFRHRGSLSDLNQAIELSRAALELCLPGHADRPRSQLYLSFGLFFRALVVQQLQSDIDEATKLCRAALDLCSPGHVDRSLSICQLAICLMVQFCLYGPSVSNIDEAFDLAREALSLRPPGHPERSWSLDSIGFGHLVRFLRQGLLSDLDDAIEIRRSVLKFHPPGHAERSWSLDNLADCLWSRFQQRGTPSDLDSATELHRTALELRPCGHPERARSLFHVANDLWLKYEKEGSLPDLDEAIHLHRAALELRPSGSLERVTSLNNLALAIWVRFEQQGLLSDLDEAFELNRSALELYPPGHPNKSATLNNLAICLTNRYRQRGLLTDLDDAINFHRIALDIREVGHPERPSSLTNLADSLRTRFQRLHFVPDLDEAIELNRAAIELHPPGHPGRYISLGNLAECLHCRFQREGSPLHLEEAIGLCRDSLALNPQNIMNLGVLAESLHSRFKLRGLKSDQDEAIDVCRSTLLRCHAGHGSYPVIIRQLGELLITKGEQSTIDEAFLQYSNISRSMSYCVTREALNAAQSWVENAERLKHPSVLNAYRTALALLDRLLAVTPSVSQRHEVLKANASTLAVDAFSCAVRHGALASAAEMLEQGRSILWAQLSRFRTPLKDLERLDEALAREFMQLSFQLRKAVETVDSDSEKEIMRIRELSARWEEALQRIRTIPGLDHFLLPSPFLDLKKAAKGGNIIIVNASKHSCDALIVPGTNADPIHVPLDIKKEHVGQLAYRFRMINGHKSEASNDERRKVVLDVVHDLWTFVVDPIVQALSRAQLSCQKRIWWCPTGDFTALPLHAAGPYLQGRRNLSDMYLSSYTPTLGALLRARRSSKGLAGGEQRFLAIGHPSQGSTSLPSVIREVEIVVERVSRAGPLKKLTGSKATVETTLGELRHHERVHLACHGHSNQEMPFSSSFELQGGFLHLTQIIQADLQDREFAFLSACRTAEYNEWTPDESIHLAAAMQFSGFRSVVGTMWAVDDTVVCRMVSAFYENMFDKSGQWDSKRVVLALHQAAQRLQKDPTIPFEQKIVFIHIGI
ncbi:TPR-like protein [Hygrophoropsis aurantiaca]|uniref:TPR-like protein n=1 Tax=Hygrophoropsis aurantiaca TaxID=72124 RepID=A0ACB8A2R7_9AGAM|nr:TPR-like protein [Hygrophoropsis aurantiaca]